MTADLIARIESADGPDWILDGAIWYSLSDRPALDPNIEPGGWPRYTASIDAALTLFVVVPDMVPSNPRKAAAAALKARGV